MRRSWCSCPGACRLTGVSRARQSPRRFRWPRPLIMQAAEERVFRFRPNPGRDAQSCGLSRNAHDSARSTPGTDAFSRPGMGDFVVPGTTTGGRRSGRAPSADTGAGERCSHDRGRDRPSARAARDAAAQPSPSPRPAVVAAVGPSARLASRRLLWLLLGGCILGFHKDSANKSPSAVELTREETGFRRTKPPRERPSNPAAGMSANPGRSVAAEAPPDMQASTP
jgi:hypothetical protein